MGDSNIREAGLKATVPRMKVLEVLEQSERRHLSAEDVYKLLLGAGEEVGLATVYRVLMQFETAGLISRHNFEGGRAVFELERGSHHDHIVCTQCGKVEEFFDETIENRQAAVVKRLGYEIKDHSLVIYGNCIKANCSRRGSN